MTVAVRVLIVVAAFLTGAGVSIYCAFKLVERLLP